MTSGRAHRRGGARAFRNGDPTTYALGEWAALEALRHRPGAVEGLVLDPALSGPRRERLCAAAASAGVPVRDDPATLRALRHRSDALALALLRVEADALQSGTPHLALVGTRNAGNLGAALRSALGFDVRDVALIASPLDPWSPHVLRASLGARFALRVAAFPDWSAYRERFAAQRPVLFAAPQPGRAGTALPAWHGGAASTLVFGPEWGAPDGVTASQLPLELPLVYIPQHGDLESHNLAVAVGIALYALRHGAC